MITKRWFAKSNRFLTTICSLWAVDQRTARLEILGRIFTFFLIFSIWDFWTEIWRPSCAKPIEKDKAPPTPNDTRLRGGQNRPKKYFLVFEWPPHLSCALAEILLTLADGLYEWPLFFYFRNLKSYKISLSQI